MDAVAEGTGSTTEGLFRPPAPDPRESRPSLLTRIRRLRSSQIEFWPRAIFEDRSYSPPLPGGPIFLMDPAAIRAVLVDQSEDFPHGALFRRMLNPVWGDGLALAEGAEWRWQRRAAAPPFRPAEMQKLAPRMRAAAEAALARWRKGDEGTPVQMEWETAHITFDILLDAVLSGGEDLDRATVRERIATFLAQVQPVRFSYLFAPDSFHQGRLNPQTKEAAQLREDVDKMIRRRRKAPPRGDLLDLFMAAVDPESGRPMDDHILRDNLLGFIVAGYATSAVSLCWALYLIASHPPTEVRLRAEVAQVTGGGPIEPEHVDRLRFTRQVLQETMRLFPPIHTNTRVCTRTVEVEGITIRAGRRVIFPVYALHRHSAYWSHPNHFDPDRWAPGTPAPDRHIYMPFGAGPRVCIGAAFAMTELVVVLGTLVRNASFSLPAGHQVWPVAEFGLNPKGGLPMHVRLLQAEGLAA